MSEGRLVAKAAKGDPGAFMALLAPHDESLRRLAFNLLGSAADMDDVLQTAYLKAFASMQTFSESASFMTWMYRIVHNTAFDELRRRSRTQIATASAPHHEVESTESRSPDLALDIDAALGQLSPEHRVVVLLIDAEGYDYMTVASILQIPPGTVSSRINQARKKLRILLSANDEDLDQ